MNFNGAVSYDLLRVMTPREFDMVMMGLREYRDEEARATRNAMASSSGNQVMGGESVRNL